MRLLAVLLFAAALAAQLIACDVEQLSGCESDDDCRFGRVCQQSLCVNPGTNQPAPDLGVGTDVPVADQSPGEGFLVFELERLDLGVLAPGTAQTVNVQVGNSGQGPATLTDAFFVEGLFEASITGPLVIGVDEWTTVEIVVTLPADAAPGSQLADLLEVASDAPNQAQLLVLVRVAAGGEVCLEAVGEQEITISLGVVAEIDVDLFNCGAVPVRLNFINIETVSGNAAELEIANAPPPDAAVAVGTSRRVTIQATAEQLGATDGRLGVLYGGGRELGFEFRVIIIVDDGLCEGTLSAQADGNGPSSIDGSLEVPIGHQIFFAALEAGASVLEIQVLNAPGLSQELLGIDSPGIWKLIPDVPGDYVLNADIGFQNGCVDQVAVTVTATLPDGDLVIVVTWPEPNTAGPYLDMDLYVANGEEGFFLWQTPGLVVGPASPNADFGAEGPIHDPLFNRDYNHDDGFGPEMVTFGSTRDTLGVGIHRFDNDSSPQPADAEVRVQVYSVGVQVHDEQQELTVDEFWVVGQYGSLTEWTTIGDRFDGIPPQTDAQ